MALSSSIVSRNVVGNQRMNIVTVGFDDSYPTGGEVFTPSAAGLSNFDAVITSPGAYDSSAYVIQWNAPYLVAFDAATGTEAADTTDLSGLSVNVLAIGR